MPFPSTLSAGQLTQVRQPSQAFIQLLLLCPNDVVFQTQPAAVVDGSTSFAEFEWSGTDQGAYTDVLQGMTVLISSTSDYRTTTFVRGRVRKAPTATTFYINEIDYDLAVTDYVTVIYDFDIHERLERRTAADVAYKDWDLTFKALPPIITGLQSVYVDTSGAATVTFDFSAVVDITASGASEGTWTWDADDGTINSGGTTATPNITFPGYATNEHRWVVATHEDDNNVSNYFAFEVYTISLTDTSSNVVALNSGDVNITASTMDGYNATVRAWDGVDTVLDRTRCAIVSVDNYGGTATPITQNVSFVGRLRMEDSPTRGDERYAVLKDTTFTIEGFATQLGHLNGPALYLVTDSAASAWGEITNLTLKRTIVYLLAWHSTFLTVSGLTFGADSDDYRFNALTIHESSLLEWVNDVGGSQNAALEFAADGQSTIQRHASIAGAGGLDTIMTLAVDDGSGAWDMRDLSINWEYIETHAQAIAGGGTYNTTLNRVIAYRGRAPAMAFSPGWETATINGQILKVNLSDADAKAEMGLRVANTLAYVNPKTRITVTLRGGLYWIVPSTWQLYAFDITATDNTRGRTFTSADKFLCIDTAYAYNAETGTYEVTATFEAVTEGGYFSNLVTIIPDVNQLGYPDLPPLSAGNEPLDPLVNYPVDDPDYELPGGGGGYNQPGPVQPEPAVGCQVLNVSMRTGNVVTTNGLSTFGNTYAVSVEGDAKIADVDWWAECDFTQSACGFAASTPWWSEPASGIWSSGIGWVHDDKLDGSNNVRSVNIGLAIDSTVISSAIMTYDFTKGSFVNPALAAVRDIARGGAIAFSAMSNGNDQTYNYGGNANPRTDLTLFVRCHLNTSSYSGAATVTKFYITGTGTIPTQLAANATNYGTGAGVRGDAFYTNYQEGGEPVLYTGTYGFVVDGSKPGSIPTYSPNHQYIFFHTGTGAPIGFKYNDNDHTDNDNRNLVVNICGDGMTQS
jgi:hypothetical protein